MLGQLVFQLLNAILSRPEALPIYCIPALNRIDELFDAVLVGPAPRMSDPIKLRSKIFQRILKVNNRTIGALADGGSISLQVQFADRAEDADASMVASKILLRFIHA
jgi:hypothetical protein